MATDKELLERAARAAGIEIHITGWDDAFVRDEDGDFSVRWSPLTDDGDALRLAAKLRISLRFRIDLAHGWWITAQRSEAVQATEPAGLSGNDPAAMRRAIVRAAAEYAAGGKPFPSAEEIRQLGGEEEA